jgi:ankyrin repeat protein
VPCLLTLLGAGADIDDLAPYAKDTALHKAASRGSVACVRALLKAGARVDIVN